MESLPPSLVALYDKYSPRNTSPEAAVICDILLESSRFSPTLYVVLDDFDECEENVLSELISAIEKMVEASIKVLFSSRLPHQCLFHGQIKRISSITVRADFSDIHKYVGSMVNAEFSSRRRKMGAIWTELAPLRSETMSVTLPWDL